MTMNRIRLLIGASLLTFTSLLLAAPGTPARATDTAAAAQNTPSGRQFAADDFDSRETREKFRELLHGYPPEVAMVLKLDPSLFSNMTWLSSYPGLAAFVAAHPEIAHSPAFYLDNVYVSSGARPDLREENIRRILDGLAGLLVFFTVTLTLAWLVKTLIEQRRWSRQSHVQTEVHSKLLDRLTSGDDVIAYVQSSAGKRFLEAAPIALDVQRAPVSAPIGRFLWSIQAGLVLAAGGFGLQFVSNQMPIELAPVVFGLGILVLSVGAGFVLSAVVSFLLARKLGLVPIAATPISVDEPAGG
jgi:hypothetical protein